MMDNREFRRIHDQLSKHRRDTFMRNLERLCLACLLIDKCDIKFEPNIVFWGNAKEHERTSYGVFFDSRALPTFPIPTLEHQDVLNMVLVVDYFIVNGFNMRTVSIEEIHYHWKKGYHEVFGDVDDEFIHKLRLEDVVTRP